MSEPMSFRFLGKRYIRAEFAAAFPRYAANWPLVVAGCTSPHEIEVALFRRNSRGKQLAGARKSAAAQNKRAQPSARRKVRSA